LEIAMRRLALVLLWVVACSAPTTPNEARTGVRVRPNNTTIFVGQSVPLSAATVDAVGDSTGVAAVTWLSSAPSVASVSDAGVATGLAAGVAKVIATTNNGAKDTATIIVNASGCYNLLRSPHLHGRVDFSYTYTTTLDSVTYKMHDNAATDFVVDSVTVDATGHRLWMGADTGSASVDDQRTDLRTGEVENIQGFGDLVVSGINLSHVIVSVDTASCAYTIEAVPYIDLKETPQPGDIGPAWFGWIRTPLTRLDTAVTNDTSEFPLDTGTIQATLAVHSVDWMATNYFGTTAWYVPLGFSGDYFGDGAPDDGSAGNASVRYFLRKGGD
jgi:hypothetical protein